MNSKEADMESVKHTEPAVDEHQHDKYTKLKRAIMIGTLLAVLIISWHLYENIFALKSKQPEQDELYALTEQLYMDELQQQDTYDFKLNLQCHTQNTSREDCAQNTLIESSDSELHIKPNSTMALLKQLFGYYEPNVVVQEIHSAAKIQAETEFLTSVLQTSIMKRTMNYLKQKNFEVHDQAAQLQLLHSIWFTPYARGGKVLGSTGFEHVFLAELRKNKVLGLHNWLYFQQQELLQHINYHGYYEHIDFQQKNHHYVSFRMTFHGKMKPINSFLIGTSPELDLSLYTLCFLLKPQKTCSIQLHNTRFRVITYVMKTSGKKTLATAYLALDK